MLPPAGQIFEKWHPLGNIERFSDLFLQFSSRVLAGVLPPAGQISEKCTSCILSVFCAFLATSKHVASMGVASGGSDS